MIKNRHYGLFATRVKQVKLNRVSKALGQPKKPKGKRLTIAEVIRHTTGRDIHLCADCKGGQLIVVKEIPPARGSPLATQAKRNIW